MFTLFKREITNFLSSLIGYIVITVFLLINGLFLWVFPMDFNILENGYANIDGLFLLGPFVFLFLIPAITMRSFAEEKRSRTIEMLLTKPLTDLQIILAKYFAGFVLILFSLLPTLIYFISVNYISNFPYILINYYFILGGTLISVLFIEIIISNIKIVTIIFAIIFSLLTTLFFIFNISDKLAYFLLIISIIFIFTFIIKKSLILKLICIIKTNRFKIFFYLFIIIGLYLLYYNPNSLFNQGTIDLGGMWGSYIGLLFLGAAFVSIGLFASTLTDSQIISFIISLFLCGIFYIGFEFIYLFDIFGKYALFVQSLGISYHYSSISRGVIDTRDLLYFLSLICVFILLSKISLERRKW